MTIPNRLLAAIPTSEYLRLLPKIEEVELVFGEDVFVAGGPIGHVYFPVSGVVSLLALVDETRTVNVGMTGREGVVGVSALLGVNESAGRALVAVKGRALRISPNDLRDALVAGGMLERVLLRFVESVIVQVTQSAACYSFHDLDRRLALWLLMASDRTGSDKLIISQTLLAMLLGVRRESVNRAVTALRQKNTIEYHRGDIDILDRPALEFAACNCYQSIRNEEMSFPRTF